MIIYKIKKIFREGGQEIIKMSLGITIILAGFIPALLIPIFLEDSSKKERIQAFIAFILSTLINLCVLLYVDSHYSYNIIFKIFISGFICFLFYLPFIFGMILHNAIRECNLTKDELRDAKLGMLVRKNRKKQ